MTTFLFMLLMIPASPDLSDEALAKSEADARNTQGKILYGKGEFAAALAEFRAAFEMERDSRYLFNAAKALERLDRAGDAFAAWSEFLYLAPSAEEREAAARILVHLCPDVGGGVVRVETTPGGAILSLDGRPFPVPVPVEVCLPPGEHKLGAARERYQPLEHSLTVAQGARYTVPLALKPVVGDGLLHVTSSVLPAVVRLDGRAVGPAPLDLKVPADEPHEVTVDAGPAYRPWTRTVTPQEGHVSSLRAFPEPGAVAASVSPSPPVEKPFQWGWVTLGASVAAVVTGAALYAVAFDKFKRADGLAPDLADYDARFDDLANSGARYQTGAWVGWGVGAALAIPTVWLFTRDADAAQAATGGN